ncbi:ferric iron reductase [Streptomyces longisporoflavus]|uniref:Ferric iron reductase n=1 Tax=Streptomyces longisporoflavus TaxID=28044 RepID=A0ABW7QI67_9ACTN
MRLEDLDDPMRVWHYAERYLGEKTRIYSRFADDADVSAACHPQRGAESFTLPSFLVPAGRGELVTNNVASTLPSHYQVAEHLVLPVHPDTLSFEGLAGREELLRCEAGPPLEVVPLANTRTVSVLEVDGEPAVPHMLKLHYPRRLSRFTRQQHQEELALQLWVAEQLAVAGVPLLTDVCAGVFGSGGQGWGFLVREPPALSADTGLFTVPLFALYGQDLHAPADRSLLEQLVAAAGEPAGDYITERIVRPMVRLWTQTLLATGCALELHGQNTLVSFTPDGRHLQILYRDCEIHTDPGLRARKGLPPGQLPPASVISRDVPFTAAAVFSLTYDSFMGHALDRLAALAYDRLGLSPAVLHEAARHTFRNSGLQEDLLPPTVHYYGDAPYTGDHFQLVDTGHPPLWR